MEILLTDILKKLPATEVVGNANVVIKRVIQLSLVDKASSDILWVSEKNSEMVKDVKRGAVICSSSINRDLLNAGCTYLLVENPRLYFLKVINHFFAEPAIPSISSTALIHPSVKLGKSCSIASGVVIEKDSILGNDVVIDANTVIKSRTIIGSRVKIGANNTIGGVGFGYEKNETGAYELLPHIGNVLIDDDVEIGNNTTIDRAVIGSTHVKQHAKIDNLVHIAHGVVVGENSLIIANAMIAGSTIIGSNVWVAPSASVLNKIVVGDDVVIGMGGVVLKDIPSGKTVVGNPAREINKSQ
jgi:UDP-3-O-[3-hydroxymyristoyl] glucosamine N-acyltransferase